MYRTNFLIFGTIISLNVFSQESPLPATRDVFKISIAGIQFEKAIAARQTLCANAYMYLSGSIGYSGNLGNTSELYYDPTISLQYRYYYNLLSRKKNGKRTEMNTANFIAPQFQTIFSKKRISSSFFVEDKRRAIYSAGIVWGLQRNYKSRFSVEGYAGPVYLFTHGRKPEGYRIVSEQVSKFSFITHIQVGFWLNKRK